MTPLAFGPLRVRRVVKKGAAEAAPPAPAPAAPLTVVLMHGYGAPGADLVALAERIDAPAGSTFLFPEAPGKLDDLVLLNLVDDARVWWSKDARRIQREVHGEGAGPETRIFEEIGPARDAVISMLDAILAETSTPSERIVLGGFSQGAVLALEVVLRTTRPLAGLVVLSGTMSDDGGWAPLMAGRRGLPVFQAHGTEDERLSFATAERLRDAMTAAGMHASFTSFADGHGIPAQVTRELGAWLTQLA